MVSKASPTSQQAQGVLENKVFKVSTPAGAGVDTNIAVTGIKTGDTLVSVLRLNRDATAANIDITDVTSEASITSDGNIQLDTTDTTGDRLIVHWLDITE